MLIYLDNSATTKPYKEVIDETIRYMETDFGNPSSLHRMGINAEKAMKEARKSVAASIGVKEDEIYFTSGGTEADNTAIFGAAQARRRKGSKIITSLVEHPAVLESCKKLETAGYQVEYIPVDRNGIIDLQSLEAKLDEQTILISVMHVNNEVGAIQPIAEIADIRSRFGKNTGTEILLHTDAVQSYGKLPVQTSGIDLMSFSGHKVHGPKGVGALYVRKGITTLPYIFGGGQERGMRSGTENVPAAAGFGVAAELSRKNLSKRVAAMSAVKAYLSEGIRKEIPDVRFNGPEEGVCSILNVSFLGVRGEVLLHTLEQSDIYVSTGSACSSRKKGQSHVLKAMGLSDREIEGAIRFSFNEFNTLEEMDHVLQVLREAVNKFRKLGSFR
jgi:cysteine desulfurase